MDYLNIILIALVVLCIAGLVYMATRKRSLTRTETADTIIFRDKDGYIVNTLKK